MKMGLVEASFSEEESSMDEGDAYYEWRECSYTTLYTNDAAGNALMAVKEYICEEENYSGSLTRGQGFE